MGLAGDISGEALSFFRLSKSPGQVPSRIRYIYACNLPANGRICGRCTFNFQRLINEEIVTMNKFLVLGALMMMAAPLAAQEQTLFDGSVQSGGFGAPAVKVTRINDQAGLMIGGSGAWIINHSLMLGGAGYGLASDVNTKGFGPDTALLDVGYGGGLIGYEIAPNDLVHIGVQALVGAGAVDYRRDRGTDRFNSYDNYDGFFVVEPGITGELNVTKNIRVNVEASWRFINGIELPGVTDAGLSGPSGTLSVKFGAF
jgi:hypothetical protein